MHFYRHGQHFPVAFSNTIYIKVLIVTQDPQNDVIGGGGGGVPSLYVV